jgi:hypothetical protein
VIGNWTRTPRPAENESSTLSGSSFNTDASTVFAEDFSADGKADSGPSSTFRGFEDVEDGGRVDLQEFRGRYH